MLGVKKIVNMDNMQTFYIYTEEGAIEISLRRYREICWNYLGPIYNHFSNSEASILISKEQNEDVYDIFDRLYNGILERYNGIINGEYKKNLSYGRLADYVMAGPALIWKSDNSMEALSNSLIIEPIDETYRVTFKKGIYLDGRTNRNFRVQMSLLDSRYDPYNSFFIDMYKDLAAMNIDDKLEQFKYGKRRLVLLNNTN